MFKILKISVLFIMILGLAGSAFTQISSIQKNEDLAELKVESLKIKTQSIEQMFLNISFSLDIPIGVEISQHTDQLTEYKIDFKGGKLSALLDQAVNLVNQNQNQYSWQIKDGVITISPLSSYRDKSIESILDAQISKFTIKEGTSCAGFARSIAETREISDLLKANSLTFQGQDLSGFYLHQLGKKFSLVLSNMTIKSSLDKIIKESPIARTWFIRRNYYNPQSITIGVFAWQEDLPIEYRKIKIESLFEDEF